MRAIWEYANPKKFITLVDRVLPGLSVLALAALSAGLIWGFFFTPDDYRQGATVLVGLGSAADVLPDPVSVLPRLYRTLAGDRGRRYRR